MPLALCKGPRLEFTEHDPRTLADALSRAASQAPDARVVTLDRAGNSTARTYRQLWDGARRRLAGLRAEGLGPGDVAVLYGLGLAEFFPTFWACVLGGIRPVAIESATADAALDRLRHTCGVWHRPLVLTEREVAEGLSEIAPELRVSVVEDHRSDPPTDDEHRPAESETALLMLSSGSTAAAKVIPLTHRGLAEFAVGARAGLGLRAGDVTLNWLPVDHSGALLLYHVLSVFVGCTNVHVPAEPVLADPLRWLDLLADYGVNHSWAPNFGYQLVVDALAANPGRTWDLSRVRSLLNGGEQIMESTVSAFLRATAPFGIEPGCVVPAWGMAETTTAITMGRWDAAGALHRVRQRSLWSDLEWAGPETPDDECATFVAVGPPAPGATVRVVDPDHRVVPEGRIGCLEVASARITPGYANDDEANEVAFPEGDWAHRTWLNTGDLAFIQDGQVVITGRSKDVIILNGQNYFCHEIEEVAASVAGIQPGAVAACGVPSATHGSEVLAVFFADSGAADVVPRRIRAAVFERLRLSVEFVVRVPKERFPKTPSGKIQRAELRRRLIDGEIDSAVAADADADAADADAEKPVNRQVPEQRVHAVVTRVLGRAVARETPFFELGATSVQLVRIAAELSRELGLRLSHTTLFEHPTVAALVRYLATQRRDQPRPVAADRPGESAPNTSAREPNDERLAIVGMSLRFPGASDVGEFWTNLRAGAHSVRRFTSAELGAAGLDDVGDPEFVPVGGVLGEADAFDHEFFGMCRREAELTHPAHRMFLECCYHALEDAGYANTGGARVGVFAGTGMSLYGHQDRRALTSAGPVDDLTSAMRAEIGEQPDFVATRVAYRLGLTGPALGVRSACSTSLVAVHLAGRAVLAGEADLALAGAAALHLPQESGYWHYPGSILSPTGQCRAFDAAADGTVGGNGIAAVVLKRLERALADGDTVHAVILGSAVNNDGAGKVGFTAPSVGGQSEVVRAALRDARVSADTITYLEAHGTGTQLGDPVEFEALTRAFAEDTGRVGFCTLGSVKPGIGHLDSCAGMAGLIKTVLMLRHREFVPTVNLDQPNPALNVSDSPFVLGTELRPWETDGIPRRAGVSALGVGGTNAHVVLEEPPEPTTSANGSTLPLVPISADNEDSLRDLAGRLRDHLRACPDVSTVDIATTMALGRPHLPCRMAVFGRNGTELAGALDAALADDAAAPRGVAHETGPLVFAFAGQGSVSRGMARRLYDSFPVLREVLDECERAYARDFGGSLLTPLLDTGGDDAEIWPTDTAQPALFAFEVALARLWRSFGVEPDFVVGHSLGEYAALVAGGAMSMLDGLWLAGVRGQLMHSATKPGGLVAARIGRSAATAIAEQCAAEVAVCNGPDSQVFTGSDESLDRVRTMLDEQGVSWRRLPVDRAFHSALLDPILPELRRAAERVAYGPLGVPMASGIDGTLLAAGTSVDADYLCGQARLPTRFDQAMHALDQRGCRIFLEIGPRAVLSGIGRRLFTHQHWATLGSDDREPAVWLALGELYCQGVAVDWSRFANGRRVSLPGYPFRRTRFPLPTRATPGEASGTTDTTDGFERMLREVTALTADRLGGDPADIDTHRSFLEQGADSLSLLAISREIESMFDVKVGIRELFADADTPRALAGLLIERGAWIAPEDPSPPEPDPAPETQKPAGQTSEAVNEVRQAGNEPAAGTEPAGIVDRQLRLAEHLVDRVTDLMSKQLDTLAGNATPSVEATAPREREARTEQAGVASPSDAGESTSVASSSGAVEPASAASPSGTVESVGGASPSGAVEPVATRTLHTFRDCAGTSHQRAGVDFSLYFFGDYPEREERDKYRLITEATRFGDQNGFHAAWLPERHFHSFGALFPNPAVLAAGLAGQTEHIRLHAGSVVLPLHHPIRVAEEWSVVDNLSHGRVGICVASGWHARDFVLAPENFGRHRELLYEQLDIVQHLWAGHELPVTAGDGSETRVRLHPEPVQAQPPMFVAVVGNPDSYRRAAARGLGVVTNLMAQDVARLADNIALYRRTRAEHGLDPDGGRVVVLVHSYLGDDADQVRAEAFEPFCAYLRSSLGLFNQVTNSLGIDIDLETASDSDVRFLLERAYQRYVDSRALIGTPESCAAIVEQLTDAGADEIACFVDFGVPPDRVLAGLPKLDELRQRHQRTAVPEPTETMEMSPAQRRIWFLDQLHTGRRTYNEPKAIRLDGPLDVTALRTALERVVARHPALRTVFHDSAGQPAATVLPTMRVECPLLDRDGATEAEVLDEALEAVRGHAFDLATGPLLVARLIRLSEQRHLLFLLAHHIVFDSASTAVLIRDLAAYYRAWPGEPAALPKVAPSTRGADPSAVAEDVDFWRDELAGAPTLALPTDHPRPTPPSGNGGHVCHELGSELAERLTRFSRTHRTTLFGTLLSSVGTVLSRFSGQRDVVVGTAVANRPPEAEQTIGMFIDTVPLRVDLAGDPTFGELVRRVTDSSMRAYEHRNAPFEELVRALNPERDPSRNPLFQVMVEFEHAEPVEFDPPRLTSTPLDVPSDRAPFDLSLYFTRHADGVRCMAEYSTDLFHETTVRRLVSYLEHVLRRAVSAPSSRLAELMALTDEDQRLLAGWQGARTDDPPECLHELVERQVDRVPESVALIGPDGALTYRELDELANRIAWQLGNRGVTRGDLVAVCLPRGPELIASLLAVLKIGAGYLPLDPTLPEQRLRFMAADGEAALLLTTGELRASKPGMANRPVQLVEELDSTASTQRPDVAVGDNELAYCIYTSGSSGRPKGVAVPHRGPVNLLRWHLREHEPMTTLQWTSPAFDVSVQEIFTTLAAGSTLVLISDAARYDPAAVTEAVREHEVRRLFMPYTPLKYLMETEPSIPSLREIFSAGEALALTPAMRRFFAAHPDCLLHNQYGPTEASIIVASHRVDPEGATHPPIGRPIDNVVVRLLDDEGQQVPVGAIGELHLGAAAVAYGYLGRAEETEAAFRADPWQPGSRLYRTGDLGRWRHDGTLEFLGRTDDQVKIRGYRVEPGEIEQELLTVDGVHDASVVPIRDQHGEPSLVGYVVLDDADTEPGWLSDRLARKLPSYLLPQRWVRMDRLPVNASGKLDRSQLPLPDAGASTGEPVRRTPLEDALHTLWCAELGRTSVPVDESFFTLGGHSLAVVRLVNRVRDELAIDYSMTRFFAAPTIRAMADHIEQERSADVVDSVPLTGAQTRLWRQHRSRPDPAIYNVAHRIDLHGGLDPAAVHRALGELVRRHAALRSRIVDRGAAPVQEFLASCPIPLPIDDLAHLADDEPRIDRWCQQQASTGFALDRAPLLSARLGRVADQRWILVLVLHHMICDGWSMRLIWRELSALYAAEVSGSPAEFAPPSAQYPDYVRWQREQRTGQRGQRLDAFWRAELAGVELAPNLPCDHPRPDRLSGRGALHEFTVPASVAADLRRLASAADTTLYVVLATAFASWLGRTSGQQDVVLAASSAKRSCREHEDIVGFIGEAIPLRVRLTDARRFTDLTARVSASLFRAMDHQALSLDEMLRLHAHERTAAQSPPVLFTVVTESATELPLPGMESAVRPVSVAGLARTELYVVCAPANDGIRVSFEYSTDLFTETTVSQWAKEFRTLLERLPNIAD